MSNTQWSQEQMMLLLETLHTETIIWDPNNKYHKNKKKINDAWVRVSETFGGSVPVEELKKKKDSLFATYRGYCRKIQASLTSGAGVDDAYRPVWFAFDFMNSFLGSVFKCKQTIATDQESGSIKEENNSSEGVVSASASVNDQNSIEASQTRRTSRRRDNPPELQIASTQMTEAFNNLNKIINNESEIDSRQVEDECDVFGKLIAKKLKKLPDHKREDLMFDIHALFQRTHDERSPSVESSTPKSTSHHSEPPNTYITNQSNESQYTYIQQPTENTPHQRSSKIISNEVLVPETQSQSVRLHCKRPESENTGVCNVMTPPGPTSDRSNDGYITVAMDSFATMKVCRVCLATSVKMYHISEYELSNMFEQITGVEVNTEDKLPQMLCWECVARLSSANNFKDKALKTSWILLNKINGNRCVTINDIKSIDKAEYQLASTLGFKYNKANDFDLHINDNDNYTDKELEFHEVKTEIDIDLYNEGQIIKTEVNDEDTTEEVGMPDFQIPMLEISIQDNVKVEDEEVSKSEREVREVTKQRKRKRASETPQSRKRKALPKTKELKSASGASLSKDNIQDSSYQLTETAKSTKDTETVHHQTIKKEILFDDENYFVDNIKEENVDPSQTVKAEKNLICDICDKPFRNKSTLMSHVLAHSKSYQCTYCSYSTCYSSSLHVHLNAKHTQTESFNCAHCSYKAYRKGRLSEHIRTKHLQHFPYQCSLCSYKTHHKISLNKHTNARHTKTVSFQCHYCNFVTYLKDGLNAHINTKHTKNVTHSCPLCSFKTFQKGNLNRHINAKHTDNFSFKCSYCSFKTSYKGTLDRHINCKHTKKTVFQCTFCDFEVRRKYILDAHINAEHTRSVSFDCTQCGYTTYAKRNLNRHLHTMHPKT